MTSVEKNTLYTFLHTAADWISENRSEKQTPDFSAPEFETLTAVETAVKTCRRCILSQTRITAVPGAGKILPGIIPVLVVGEAPGAEEDTSGQPFVGNAGKLLDKMLAAINLSRNENCYITNVVKCRPPNNRDPLPEETGACRLFLDAQIALIKPVIILSLGKIATQNLLNTSDGITKLRGHFYAYHGIPLLPTFHPSALLRNEDLKRPVWEDLKLLRAELDRLLTE